MERPDELRTWTHGSLTEGAAEDRSCVGHAHPARAHDVKSGPRALRACARAACKRVLYATTVRWLAYKTMNEWSIVKLCGLRSMKAPSRNTRIDNLWLPEGQPHPHPSSARETPMLPPISIRTRSRAQVPTELSLVPATWNVIKLAGLSSFL